MSASPAEDEKPVPSPHLRRETFLARYPRKLKLTVVVLLVIAFGFSWGRSPVFHPRMDERKIAPLRTIFQKATSPTAPASPDKESGTSKNTNTSANAAALNDQDDHSIKMAPAPDPGLTEDTPQGSLPRISDDGRQPWQVYARSFNTADQRPRIAIVIADLGLAREISDTAISRLPTNVTLAFDAQSPVVGAWCARARQSGHEVLLSVPMEPFDYPRSDPGPNTLLTTLTNTDNLERLMWALRQSTGYVGITTLSGSRFTTDPEKLRPVLESLRQRGLLIFDARVAPHSVVMDMAHDMHLSAVGNTVTLGQELSPEDIDTSLNQLEKTARLTGRATAVVSPVPILLDRLQVWLKDLPSHGIALAPISAMAQ